MPTPTTRDELMALAAYADRGDPQVFEALVLRYQGMVYATCRRQLASAADAEDAAQETFLKLARKAGSIRSNLSAWLHACAVGTSRDLARRSRTREHHEQQAGVQPRFAPDATWRELGPEVDAAMEALGERDRELLVERFLVGTPQTELAGREGVSPSAVHQRVGRAVERLREQLRSRGVPVAGAALAGLLARAAEAAVPETVTASAMKIGVAGLGHGQGGGSVGSLLGAFSGVSLIKKLAAVAAVAALATGAAVTLGPLGSHRAGAPGGAAGPPATAPAAAAEPAPDPREALLGAWENRGLQMDGRPAAGATLSGRRFRMFAPSFIPGDDRLEMTYEIVATEPDARPGKLVLILTQASTPVIPITGQPVEASYRVDEASLVITANFMGGDRPESLDPGPGRWVLACRRDPADGPPLTMDDGLDPGLAGRWTGIVPSNMVIEQGVIYTTTPDGQVLTESEILRWDTRARPMRCETIVIRSAEYPQLVGSRALNIFELRGDTVTFAYHDFTSPKADRWPRDFTGRPGDRLLTTTWSRMEGP